MSIRLHWPAPTSRNPPLSTWLPLPLCSIPYLGAVIIILQKLGRAKKKIWKKISNKMKSKVKWPQELNLWEERESWPLVAALVATALPLPVISCPSKRMRGARGTPASMRGRRLATDASWSGAWRFHLAVSVREIIIALAFLPFRGNPFVPWKRVDRCQLRASK